MRRPDLPDAQRLFAEDERNAVLLAHPAMASDAILIQDGPDIPAEFHLIGRCAVEERMGDWPKRTAQLPQPQRVATFNLELRESRRLCHGYLS